MNKLYNNYNQVSSNLKNFFTNINIPLSNFKLDFLFELIVSIILTKSNVISNISKKTFSFNHIQDESIQKKIRRFFDSKKFNPYDIYDSIINFVIENYNINCTYVFRTRKEIKIKYFDKSKGHYIWKQLSEFNHIKERSKVLKNIEYTISNPTKKILFLDVPIMLKNLGF